MKSLEIEDFEKRGIGLGELWKSAKEGQLTSEQTESLMRIAMEQYEEGADLAGTELMNIVSECDDFNIAPLEHDCLYLKYVPTTSHLKYKRPRLFMDLFRRKGIVRENEISQIVEVGFLTLGDSRGYRVGRIGLTTNKLIIVGMYTGLVFHKDVSYRLHYENIEQRRYLNSMDILDLSRITDIRSEWKRRSKQIVMRYKTKYYREKGTTLYGPLFFKVKLPKKVKGFEGNLEIKIQLADIPNPGSPKDYTRLRQEELFRRIKATMSGIDLI